ncbi:DNA repair ATPase [Spirillospora sp. NPDC047279]|uniref:DNA repair ATPase n=1 Tax=Spirillospora sp. NPDC047279 TaxID=3155478 RepID=UPI0033EB210E
MLRARLAGQAAELARRAEALNARRLETFGGTELTLAGTHRIRTGHACVPRDVLPVGAGLMLVGTNAVAVPGTEATVDEVFALRRLTTASGPEASGPEASGADGGTAGPGIEDVAAGVLPELLRDPTFERDFAEMYRYYRQARLLRLRRLNGLLLAVFQTGPRLDDVRVLRWKTNADGDFAYVDNRGERDHVLPPAHDFDWIETTRDDHVPGRRPHVSIEGEVFVTTTGGSFTVKVEDDTGTGPGVHEEPVDEPLQSLADADVLYARVGALILLRVRPYNETGWRHLVFNTRTKTVVRLDGIAQACRRLPGDQGIVFPGGHYLDTGTAKTFDIDVTGLEYERSVRSPNGEDVLYVFHSRSDGRSLLLHYNVIRKQVATPITGRGHALFDDGTLVVLRASTGEPSRVHPVQIWRTPYVSDAHAAARPAGTGPLERVGNADLVRGISDCLSVVRMAEDMSPSTEVFEGLIAACVRTADLSHWLGEADLGDLLTPLGDLRATARQVLEEYANVQALTREAAAAVGAAAERVGALIRAAHGREPGSADAWVARLAELRRAQGHLETLRDLRYADVPRLDELTAELAAEQDAAAGRTVRFLQTEGAFAGYHEEVGRLDADAAAIGTAADAAPVAERLAAQAEGLEIVTEVVGTLDVTDATIRTTILERAGEVMGGLNRARAVLDARRRELLDIEGRAAFAAEFALLDQAVAGALAQSGTPERCDEHLGRLLLQLESLEARFAEFDDFVERLEGKRGDVYEAFSARKQALLDERSRRADRLTESAERILTGVRRRAVSLASPDEVNAYFATDAMVTRLRRVSAELRDLGEIARAEELDGRLKTARQEAGRALRDRRDLYDDDGAVIVLGRHRFAVNTQPMELTLVPHDGALAYAVTGTGYRAPVRDEAFAETRPFWDQLLPSETPGTYRAEYLAASILLDAERAGALADLDAPLDAVRRAAAARIDEGYERGVHDHDAAAILEALLGLHTGADLLRYTAAARAAAQLFWAHGTDATTRAAWATRAASLARARTAFGRPGALDDLAAELDDAIASFTRASFTRASFAHAREPLAGDYLVEELARGGGFITGSAASALLQDFRAEHGDGLDRDLNALTTLADRHRLAEAWLTAFRPGPDLPEAVALLLCPDLERRPWTATPSTTVDGLLGTHPRLTGGRLDLRLDELLTRVHLFHTEHVPAFRAYQRRRTELIAAENRRLRLDDHRPRVLGSFVRNRLIDEVYLPLIGDNLAKQLGPDPLGLLLLISPPGYGKTTLIEYVADRLGLLLVKVDGPALGRSVTSLDPAAAPDATSRREVEKINFALELGTNVLLYLDDVQHTSPELLQKFIPLCDGQRRIEGHDLRGKRFAVCMAGNPYTESGGLFQIPDMLANRADVWNLGDVLSGRDDVFALSYLENALTANPVLAPLSTRDRGDLELLIRLASGDQAVQLSHPYSRAELDQMLAVLTKLLHVQRTVLTVNRAYIASAAQSDGSRTEPPFRLQGSYRDMNKLAARVLPAMNDTELEALIDDHYRAEAQTLTSAAEANLLKLAELRGRLTPAGAARWTQIKTFSTGRPT